MNNSSLITPRCEMRSVTEFGQYEQRRLQKLEIEISTT